MINIFHAIGKAVYSAQLFETVLTPVFEIYKIKTKPGYLEKTQGYISNGAFKVPISSVVKELAKSEDISPDLEERLNTYSEKRHQLIHRWILENGSSVNELDETNQKLYKLATEVDKDANELCKLFTGYLLKYAEPKWAEENPEIDSMKMRDLFKDINNDN